MPVSSARSAPPDPGEDASGTATSLLPFARMLGMWLHGMTTIRAIPGRGTTSTASRTARASAQPPAAGPAAGGNDQAGSVGLVAAGTASPVSLTAVATVRNKVMCLLVRRGHRRRSARRTSHDEGGRDRGQQGDCRQRPPGPDDRAGLGGPAGGRRGCTRRTSPAIRRQAAGSEEGRQPVRWIQLDQVRATLAAAAAAAAAGGRDRPHGGECGSSGFAVHLPGVRVAAKPAPARVPQAPVTGPLGERDLAGQARFHPARARYSGAAPGC